MPLKYDDIPGSWGLYSTGWPELKFATADDAKRAYIACVKEGIAPYGSYVLDDLALRVETEAYKTALAVYLAESPFYKELLDTALSLFEWALDAHIAGKEVATIDHVTNSYKVLKIEGLEDAHRPDQSSAASGS